MSINENPSVTSTEKQVAWATWQFAKQEFDSDPYDPNEPQPNLISSKEERERFESWWATVMASRGTEVGSMRDLMRATWDQARTPRFSFEHWWDRVLRAIMRN